MKAANLCLFLFLLFSYSCKKDSIITDADSGNNSVQVYDFAVLGVGPTSDNGYILAANDKIALLNSTGGVIWTKNISEFNNDSLNFNKTVFRMAAQTSDGNFAALGFVLYKQAYHYVLIKISSSGKFMWASLLNRPYIGSIYSDAFTFVVSKYGGFVVSVQYTDNSFTSTRALIKLDKNGKVYSENPTITFDIDLRDLTEDKDGSIILAGTNPTTNSSYIMKFDSTCQNQLFAKGFKFSKDENVFNRVFVDKDGNYVMSGYADKGKGYDLWNYQFSLMKISASGDSLTSVILGTTKQDYSFYSVLTQDKGFAILGTSSAKAPYDEATLKSSMYLVKLSSSMDIKSAKFYGENMDTKGVFVKENTDGGFTMIGRKYGYNNIGRTQSVFIRTTPEGTL